MPNVQMLPIQPPLQWIEGGAGGGWTQSVGLILFMVHVWSILMPVQLEHWLAAQLTDKSWSGQQKKLVT